MKRIILILVAVILSASLASAEIIINQQPKEIYNLGERLDFPITVATINEGIYDFLEISLNCQNHLHILPKEEISLAPGEAIKITKSIFLIDKFVGNALGDCRIRAWFEDSPENFILSNEFKIVDSMTIGLKIDKTEFNPGENVLIEGTATKQNSEGVNGFIELTLILGNSSENRTYQGVIIDGSFSINFDLLNDAKAGEYLLKIDAHEKDPLGEITNKGSSNINLQVNQVPTSLEIVFENQEVEPGTNLKVKSILHDQTGEKINSNVIISIKNKDNKILEQIEKQTDEFLEFSIAYNEPPANWTVVAASNRLTSEMNFKIKEKKDVKVEIINKTIILTNIGNVLYNKVLLVKIGNESVDINANLKVDESKKYTLYAPDGKYLVEIIADGESKITTNIPLTGNAINIKEASDILILAKYPLAWFFIIFVLGFIAFMIFKKGYKKSFFGHISFKGKGKKPVFSRVGKDLIKTKNKAELTLSLSGEKQKASIICLKIKNFKEIEKKPDSIKETLEKITEISEENKAFVYENHENLFFILAPAMTKTFDNEKKALKLAQKIERLLKDHNKLFRQKIDFGISLNSGEIISKKDGDILKFMSFGNLIINAKKIASVADSEVYLSEKMKEKLMPHAKIEKHKKQGVDVYKVKEIKEKGEHKKFISDFLKRLEKKDSKED